MQLEICITQACTNVTRDGEIRSVQTLSKNAYCRQREIQSTINLFFVEYKPVKLETGSTFSDTSLSKVSQCYHTLAWSLPDMVESLFGVVKNILQRRPHDQQLVVGLTNCYQGRSEGAGPPNLVNKSLFRCQILVRFISFLIN